MMSWLRLHKGSDIHFLEIYYCVQKLYLVKFLEHASNVSFILDGLINVMVLTTTIEGLKDLKLDKIGLC